jgi:restriction system protein
MLRGNFTREWRARAARRRRGTSAPEARAGCGRSAGKTTLVQRKQWKTWKVGVTIVRELYGVMAAENAARGIVVTCGRFTREARAFAEGKPLELVDGPALWRLVREVKTGPDPEPGPFGTPRTTRRAEPQSERTNTKSTPACPKCGSPMVLRTARRGPQAGSQFNGCPRFPACRGIRKLRPRST